MLRFFFCPNRAVSSEPQKAADIVANSARTLANASLTPKTEFAASTADRNRRLQPAKADARHQQKDLVPPITGALPQIPLPVSFCGLAVNSRPADL